VQWHGGDRGDQRRQGRSNKTNGLLRRQHGLRQRSQQRAGQQRGNTQAKEYR